MRISLLFRDQTFTDYLKDNGLTAQVSLLVFLIGLALLLRAFLKRPQSTSTHLALTLLSFLPLLTSLFGFTVDLMQDVHNTAAYISTEQEIPRQLLYRFAEILQPLVFGLLQTLLLIIPTITLLFLTKNNPDPSHGTPGPQQTAPPKSPHETTP